MSGGWFETRWSNVLATVFVAVLSLAGCGSGDRGETVPAVELTGTFVSIGNPGGEGVSVHGAGDGDHRRIEDRVARKL